MLSWELNRTSGEAIPMFLDVVVEPGTSVGLLLLLAAGKRCGIADDEDPSGSDSGSRSWEGEREDV